MKLIYLSHIKQRNEQQMIRNFVWAPLQGLVWYPPDLSVNIKSEDLLNTH